MSAPSESAASPAPCACTNISLMQLFHELKQKFPGVPDHVVSNTIELYCHDKQACETHLHSEVKASLTHAYHASSLAAARQLNELKLNPPLKCRNQPIVKHEIAKSTAIKSITCQGPQKAIISSGTVSTVENSIKPTTDANQNIVEAKNCEIKNNVSSPVTVINIDNCYVKYNAESPSDLELTNENVKEKANTPIKEDRSVPSIEEEVVLPFKENTGPENLNTPKDLPEQPESTNYRILKSNKIKSNLNERLEKGKVKKTIKKEEPPKEIPQEKPKRPNTLDFIKPNPDIAFKPTLKEPESDTCRTVSPAPSISKNESPSVKDARSHTSYRQERPDRGYPLNVSVNVNCHMDLSRGYGDPWLEDYDSPRAITSVNLTVCTPTSNMASPVRDSRDDDGGFEGHVTVTVSPSTARPPRRRAPPPPQQPSRIDSPRPNRVAPEPPGSTIDRSLIERQKERLNRLALALNQEKGRLAQLTKETQILAGPPPTPSAAQRLREYVERLRDQCNTLSKKLEMGGNETDDTGNFYSNIYTGQRPSSSWQCHMCTFRNHPLLDKCEECDMPRIFVVRAPDGITVRLMPGRRKITRSWVL
ncbi:hypothetical protein K1T71_009593 [Dendrolimus kikuchii]|uniref:Uncharacterized protein n=1 Tax=Dendrolimus kikuchii TaxID=765133 RepID=A0ACC1CST2_9NEOP|nr:hypothetical protein K1T71_009593 [Dendrolimus kikuchii]